MRLPHEEPLRFRFQVRPPDNLFVRYGMSERAFSHHMWRSRAGIAPVMMPCFQDRGSSQ
jgi:hypothetical protein